MLKAVGNAKEILAHADPIDLDVIREHPHVWKVIESNDRCAGTRRERHGDHSQTSVTPMENQTENGAALPSRDLLALAESKEDKQETTYAAELFLLREVASKSSDLVKGREWEEFREACGGMGCLEAAHAAAVRAWEQWHANSEG